ncbi:MAG: cation:proton antiporter [Cellvibrionaceae bacterium]
MEVSTIDAFFLIFSGAALLATFALWARQPLLVAYIALGVILGPYGTAMITDTQSMADLSHTGIIFLLFLLGLDMQPKALMQVLNKAFTVTLVSSALFALVGTGVAHLSGFGLYQSLLIGGSCMFSSTIIGIKLLPTTVLHHRHTGELMIGILLLQDFIAILLLIALLSAKPGGDTSYQFLMVLIALPLLVLTAFTFVRWVLLPLIHKFDRFHEYIFLLAIGWCIGLAVLAEHVNLSAEIGAFIAGITLATSPIAQYIAISLKPLRDFFLVIFFFATGAQLNITLLPEVIWPVLILSAAVLVCKPVVFRHLLGHQSEKKKLAWDLGFRLGQNSEFALLVAFLATSVGLLDEKGSLVIQGTAIITLLISSYLVVFYFPNPIAVKDHLRRD